MRYPLILSLTIFNILSSQLLTWADETTVQPKAHRLTQLLSGFTQARQTIDISSEVGGRCVAVHGEIGTTIPESGILAKIDTTFIQLDIEANRIEVESIKRQLKTERKTLARYTTLINRNSATEATLDEVTLKVDLHEMSLKTLNNQYLRLQEKLSRHTITAPKGWTLVAKMIEAQEYIQPGQVIGTVGDYSQLIIQLALSHRELNNLQQQKEISVSFPDLDLLVPGTIYRISPTFSETTKKIPVDIIIDNRNQQPGLRGGLRGEIHLLKEKEKSFLLPISSIISRYNAHWVVKENNERVRVLLLGTIEDGTTAVISSKDINLEDKILKKPAGDF